MFALVGGRLRVVVVATTAAVFACQDFRSWCSIKTLLDAVIVGSISACESAPATDSSFGDAVEGPSGGCAALTGAMWAGLFGLILGGPVGWIAGLVVGASAGGQRQGDRPGCSR